MTPKIFWDAFKLFPEDPRDGYFYNDLRPISPMSISACGYFWWIFLIFASWNGWSRRMEREKSRWCKVQRTGLGPRRGAARHGRGAYRHLSLRVVFVVLVENGSGGWMGWIGWEEIASRRAFIPFHISTFSPPPNRPSHCATGCVSAAKPSQGKADAERPRRKTRGEGKIAPRTTNWKQ